MKTFTVIGVAVTGAAAVLAWPSFAVAGAAQGEQDPLLPGVGREIVNPLVQAEWPGYWGIKMVRGGAMDPATLEMLSALITGRAPSPLSPLALRPLGGFQGGGFRLFGTTTVGGFGFQGGGFHHGGFQPGSGGGFGGTGGGFESPPPPMKGVPWHESQHAGGFKGAFGQW